MRPNPYAAEPYAGEHPYGAKEPEAQPKPVSPLHDVMPPRLPSTAGDHDLPP